MLKKMLRYDFKAILKYWWIGLLSTFVLAIGAGFCGYLLKSEKEFPDFIYVMAIFVIVIAVISVLAFIFSTSILLYIRYYKNLFTDEGYLTFTLPLKRCQILNSKLITGVVMSIATTIVVNIEVAIALCITYRKEILTPEQYNDIVDIISLAIKENDIGIMLLFVLLVILITAVISIASILFTFMCITVGSVLTTKNKVLTAIGIYYAASTAITLVFQILFLFGIRSMIDWIGNINDDVFDYFVLGALFIVLFFVIMISSILYAINYWLLDKKLNLS